MVGAVCIRIKLFLLLMTSCTAAGCSGSPGPGVAPSGSPSSAALGTDGGDREVSAIGDPGELVTVRLLADVTRVAASQELTVATEFTIAPGWHVYWLNPGESGLPTEVELIVPEGFVAGATRYPGPVRFESPGPVVNYGYAGTVMLSHVVLAPDVLPAGGVEFTTKAKWLACREDACVPGRGEAALLLPPADRDNPSAPDHGRRMAAHRTRLPRPLTELAGAEIHRRRAGREIELVVVVPGTVELAFFPGPDSQTSLVGTAVVPAAGQTSLRLRYPEDRAPAMVTGVVAVGGDGEWHYYSVEFTDVLHGVAPAT